MLNALIANKFPGIVITKIYMIERTVDSEQAYWIDFERAVLKPPPTHFSSSIPGTNAKRNLYTVCDTR